MRVSERLRNLDRRAETLGKRFQRQYDTEPPAWIRYGWLLTLIGPLTIPLRIATSRVVSLAVVATVFAVYCFPAFRWVSKHRV